VANVLDDLAAQRLQSDARYAESYLRSRAERGYGPQRIALELKQRGTSEDVIQHALRDAECAWLEVAVRADRKKFGALADREFEITNKRRRYLEYRGFTAEQIKAVLNAEHELD
jgi:regulatory protein